MAATAKINEWNGASGSQVATDKTGGTIRFKTADSAAVDLNNPIQVPGAGSNWSFEKWLRANFTGTFTQITNVGLYTDGANGWTGVNLWLKTAAAYATPALGSASAGYSDAFGYNSGAPLDLGAGTVTGTGDAGDFAVALMEVTSAAAQGALAAESLTLTWDEI